LTEDVIALPCFFLAAVACMNHPAYWKFAPPEKPYFLLTPPTHTIEPSSRAYTRRLPARIMFAMASRDTQWTVRIGGSASRPRPRLPTTGGVATGKASPETATGATRLGEVTQVGGRWLFASRGGPSVDEAPLAPTPGPPRRYRVQRGCIRSGQGTNRDHTAG
jgi:hypothetical protein